MSPMTSWGFFSSSDDEDEEEDDELLVDPFLSRRLSSFEGFLSPCFSGCSSPE